MVSDKLLGLKEMEVLASKHLPNMLDEIRGEIAKEESLIRKRDIVRKRKKLIGK